MFELFPRICVLDVDLFHQASSQMDYCTPLIVYPNILQVREQLFHYIVDDLSPDSIVDFAWNLNYLVAGSYYHKFVIFIDAHRCRQDAIIGELIGKYWRESIPFYPGDFFNHNANYRSSRKKGIGVIKYDDVKAREGLYSFAQQITKFDYYLQSVIPQNEPAFGIGGLTKAYTLN